MAIYCIIPTVFTVLCSAKVVASSESLCHLNDIQGKHTASLPQITVRNLGNAVVTCPGISLLLFSYFSSFLYSAITKYAGGQADEIIFTSSFTLKERGIR